MLRPQYLNIEERTISFGGPKTGGAINFAVAGESLPGTSAFIAPFTGRQDRNSAAFRRTLIVSIVIYGTKVARSSAQGPVTEIP
jgi:hypothetical protein